MGWLKDLMNNSASRVPSFGRLAQLCLEHPEWPGDSKIKERSLSTLFSKIDRGQESEWLRERPAIQKIIATLLGRSPSEVRLGLGESSISADGRLLRLFDVRYAREVDLTRESLPPGIPADILDPPSWGPTLWLAKPGAGRSLAGAFLHARGLAKHAIVRTADDFRKLPPRGALFLELQEDVELDAATLASLRPTSRPLCIAADVSGEFFEDTRTTFITIESPKVEEYLPELVDWIDARLGEEGHFDAESAEHWMRKVALPAGAVRHLGDALGLLGMLDELSPKNRAGKSLAELGSSFVRTRIRESTDPDVFGPKVADETFTALEFAATRALLVQRQSIRIARSESEWTALLAEQSTDESPDPAWFHTALRTTLGRSISRKELRRATKLLPPQAFQLVRALEHADLLRKVRRHASARDGDSPEDDALELGPHFLVRLLEAHAENEALSFSSPEWGKLLLEPAFRENVARALFERAERENWDAHFAVLEEDALTSPAATAALEVAFSTMAFAEATGKRPPLDLSRALARELERTFVRIEARREPLVAPHDSGIYSRDAILAAWFVFSFERSDSLSLRGHSREFLEACVEAAHRFALSKAPSRELTLPLLRAVVLEGALSASGGKLSIFRLFRGLSLDEESFDAERGALEGLFRELAARVTFPGFLELARLSGVSRDACLARLWALVGAEAEPFAEWSESRAEIFAAIPLAILEARLGAELTFDFKYLPPHRFSEYLRTTKLPIGPSAARHAPLEVLRGVRLPLGKFRAKALDELAAQSPTFVANLYVEATLENIPLSRAQIDGFPRAAAEAFLERCAISPELRLKGGAVEVFLRILRAGFPGHETAFALLSPSNEKATGG